MRRIDVLALLLFVCFVGITATAFSQTSDDSDKPEPEGATPQTSRSLLDKQYAEELLYRIAEDNRPEEEQVEPTYEVRVYDVSDFVPPSSDRRAKIVPLLTNGNPHLFLRKDESANLADPFSNSDYIYGRPIGICGGIGNIPEEKVDIKSVITTFVTPNDWNGGFSEVEILDGTMIVRATEDAHKQIDSLLSAIRRQTANRAVISIETHWLWLTREQATGIYAGENDGQIGPCLVGPQAWKELTLEQAKARENCEARDGYHSIISCVNGQTVSALAGRQQHFIMSVIPVVGDDGESQLSAIGQTSEVRGSLVTRSPAVGYQPTVVTIHEGAAIEIRPVIRGNAVMLDLRARVIQIESGDQEEAAKPSNGAGEAAGGQSAMIRELAEQMERPVLKTSRLDTTLRIPIGKQMLAGGMTGEVEPAPGDRSLYLFVKPIVHGRATNKANRPSKENGKRRQKKTKSQEVPTFYY